MLRYPVSSGRFCRTPSYQSLSPDHTPNGEQSNLVRSEVSPDEFEDDFQNECNSVDFETVASFMWSVGLAPKSVFPDNSCGARSQVGKATTNITNTTPGGPASCRGASTCDCSSTCY